MEYDVSSAISLISHTHSVAADFLQQKMQAEGLPSLVSSHGFILFCLSKQNKLLLGELAEKINRDKSTTTVLVRKLEEEAFVYIERDAADSRKRHVCLTEKGKAYNAVTSHISQELLATCYDGFSVPEKTQFTALLERVHQNICNGLQKSLAPGASV